MAEAKKDCHWWLTKTRCHLDGCAALTQLQCSKRGKCSFYETEEEYQKRMQEFEDAQMFKAMFGKGWR
jgi:hypothetical protein